MVVNYCINTHIECHIRYVYLYSSLVTNHFMVVSNQWLDTTIKCSLCIPPFQEMLTSLLQYFRNDCFIKLFAKCTTTSQIKVNDHIGWLILLEMLFQSSFHWDHVCYCLCRSYYAYIRPTYLNKLDDEPYRAKTRCIFPSSRFFFHQRKQLPI